MKNFDEIYDLLLDNFGKDVILDSNASVIQPYIQIDATKITSVCQFLHDHEQTYFDFLSCLTALDNGQTAGTMEVLYHLYSIPYEHSLVLKVILERPKDDTILPKVNSVSAVWQTANWHEREAYDLLGIEFVNHPDLRRILLPKDWEGFPLRKDYIHQERYHGIKVKY